MRIAGGTILRRYMHNLERNMGNQNREQHRLFSARNFNRASENPIAAARSLRIRKAISDINVFQDNLKTANMIYENAESSIMKVSAIMQTVYEQLIYGATGSVNRDDAVIIAETIDRNAEEMVQLMNIVVADRRIFGGINNSSRAFSTAPSGGGTTVFYHGQPVNMFQDPSHFRYSGVSYADIGIGIGMTGANLTGRIDPQSAIPITFNGAAILGSGLDGKRSFLDLEQIGEPAGGSSLDYSLDISVGSSQRTVTFTIPAGATDTSKVNIINNELNRIFGSQVRIGASGMFISQVAGSPEVSVINTLPSPGQPAFEQAVITETAVGFSSNVIQLTFDAAQALKNDDRLLAAQFADALFALQTNVSLELARIGNMQQFIEFNLDRTTNNMMSLLEQQKDLEASKPEEQITLIKVLESIFNAQLQMGAQMLPMSIFNFIR
jgi:flagellin-like hook-associated protein FlgL